ncbi:MAG: hypothetical protein ACOYXN_05935 [Acidobacteriota bacterium]
MGKRAGFRAVVWGLLGLFCGGLSFLGTVPESERAALKDFYYSTNGASWTVSTNWLGAVGTEGTWFGVTVETVDGADHVTRIELPENNLTGDLPLHFDDLPELRVLDLHSNYLLNPGPIPDCGLCSDLQILNLDDTYRSETSFPSWIPSLSSLQVLSLYFNDLSGTLPSTLWDMTSLTKLDLGVQNQYDDTHGFSGVIPADVTDLVNLSYLDLSYNQFTGMLPDLSSMTNLNTLFLGVNPVDSQSFPNWVTSMTHLTQLGLEQLGLKGSIPASIGNLTNLTLLSLENNPFNPAPAPLELTFLTHLEQLDLRSCNLTSLPDLSPLTAMKRLYLGSNPLPPGPIPPWILGMTSLEILQMSGVNLNGTVPEGLCALPNLLYLSLADNDLSGSIPSQIGNLTLLRYLYLNGNALTGDIPAGLGNCTLLRYLYLQDNHLTGTIPPSLGNCTALRNAFLQNNELSGGIPSSLGGCLLLSRLWVHNNRLTGPLPSELGNCAALRSLYVQGNALSGEIPASFANLTLLYPGQLDLRWNALHSSDPALTAFLDSKQVGGDWRSTQTVAPTSLSVDSSSSDRIALSWTTVSYTSDPGGYVLYYSGVSGGPYTYNGSVASKLTGSAAATGLLSGTTYFFVLRTYTAPHANNSNTVYSDDSLEVSGSTTGEPVAPGETAPDGSLLWNDSGGVSWTSNPDAAEYRVYRGDPGDLPNLFSTTENACLAWSGTTVTSAPLTAEPAPGSFHWYAVVGVNSGLEGIAGRSSSGDPEVVVSSGNCP